MEIQIFAEGDDINFLTQYINHLGLPVKRVITNNTQGWTNLKMVHGKFDEATNKGVINLVVFDANGDFEQRKKDLEKEKKSLNIQFELFLFPDDFQTGMVETLLLDIVPEAQKPFLDCFDAYWNSIQQLNPNFKFSFKSKFFAYLEATGQNHKMKEINFLDNNHWNLNSPALDNLKAFLYKNIH